MILNPNINNYIEGLPFSAIFDESKMVVKISTGRIYNCYNNCGNESDQVFTNGCRYFEIPEKSIEVGFNDWVFLDLRYEMGRKEDYKDSCYYVVSESDRSLGIGHSGKENPILVWKAPSESGGAGNSILSDNIYIQDYDAYREVGFQIKKIAYSKTRDFYKINPGFVVCSHSNFIKYIPGITFDQPKGESVKRYRIKVSLSGEVSGEDPINHADIAYFNNVSISDAILEEEDESEEVVVHLSVDGNILDGHCFINNEHLGFGNIHFKINAVSSERILIEPFLETEVRAARYYKNGVETSNFPPELIANQGFYKEIVETLIYERFRIISGAVEKISDYTITKTYSVENPDQSIVENPPVVTVSIEEVGLGSNEFIVSPAISHEIYLDGEEITNAAYLACKTEVSKMDWVNIDDWTGDGTPIFNGAGFEGVESKLNSQVVHSERRFKQIGQLSGEIERADNLRNESFDHYCFINWTDGSEKDEKTTLEYNSSEGVFTNNSFEEIEIKEEGVYGKEVILNPCEAQAQGGYLYKDITKSSSIYYQYLTLEVTRKAFSR